MEKLTKRQQEILDFVRKTLENLGAPPTRAEIAKAFSFRSANAAEEHLRALARKGALTLEPGAARGIRLKDALGLPLIGSVAAGSPILASENVLGHFALDQKMFFPHVDFLLKVRGLSMSGIGILDGDYLAVHKTAEARDGQIVVARVDDEVTVKRFKRLSDRIQLHPENPEFPVIEVLPHRHHFAIEGLAVGVMRGF